MREAACKAHASVAISDRFTEAVHAPRNKRQEPFKSDNVVMVWREPVHSKGSACVSMEGSLWRCTQLYCNIAVNDEARGLEI